MCTGSKRQTLLYMSEVFKGSNTQKIRNYGHEKSPYYATLSSWQVSEIHRLMHKLVLDDYLQEELIFCRDIPQAYLRLGKNIEKLMKGQVKIDFPMLSAKKTKTSAPAVASVTALPAADGAAAPLVLDAATAIQMTELKDRCHNDLLDACRRMAAQKNVTMVSVMNMQAIKAMSDRLPESEADMLQIPHVTQANFVKYGKELLIITQQYAAEKLCKCPLTYCKQYYIISLPPTAHRSVA